MGCTVLAFGQNFLKRQYSLNGIVVWPKFSKKRVWIEQYCLYIKIFLKDNTG